MSSLKITSLKSFKIKKYEKEIRRYLSKMTNIQFLIENTNEVLDSCAFHAYMFKSAVDHIYEFSTETRFPFHMLLIYASLFARRNLKTDSFESPYEDDYDLYLELVKNYDFITLSVYDEKTLFKPPRSYWDICCAVNKKREAIVPIKFSRDLSALYSKWFHEGELVQHNKVDVGEDLELINKLNIVLG